MTYQRASEAPRRGISEEEIRIRKLLTELEIPYRINQIYCFACRNAYTNPYGYNFPDRCTICGTKFDEYGMYCLPDFILVNGESKGVLYVNGPPHEEKKVMRRDKLQIRKFMSEGWPVFIINNEEVDNMHDATLKAYLYAIWRAVIKPHLRDRFYAGEVEYPALR